MPDGSNRVPDGSHNSADSFPSRGEHALDAFPQRGEKAGNCTPDRLCQRKNAFPSCRQEGCNCVPSRNDRLLNALPQIDPKLPESLVGVPKINKGSHQCGNSCDNEDDRIGKHGDIQSRKCCFYCTDSTCDFRNDCHNRTNRRDYLSDHNKNGTDSRRKQCNRYNHFLCDFVHTVQPVHELLYPADNLLDGRHQQLAKGNGKTLKSRFQNRDLSLQVVELSICHLLCGSGTVCDRVLQAVPGIAGVGKQSIDRCKVGLIEYGGDDIGFVSRSHAVHALIEVTEDVVERTHISVRVINRNSQGIHLRRRFVGWILQRQNHISQMGTAFSTLDTVVGKDAKSSVQLCRTALDGLCRCADGQDTFAKLCHRGVGGRSGLCHLVDHLR